MILFYDKLNSVVRVHAALINNNKIFYYNIIYMSSPIINLIAPLPSLASSCSTPSTSCDEQLIIIV